MKINGQNRQQTHMHAYTEDAMKMIITHICVFHYSFSPRTIYGTAFSVAHSKCEYVHLQYMTYSYRNGREDTHSGSSRGDAAFWKTFGHVQVHHSCCINWQVNWIRATMNRPRWHQCYCWSNRSERQIVQTIYLLVLQSNASLNM